MSVTAIHSLLQRPATSCKSILSSFRSRVGRWAMAGASVLLLGFTTVPAWRHLYPASAAPGWSMQVRFDAIERVSALAPDGRGGLYVSQEFDDSKGRILRLGVNGDSKAVETGLSKPDGMVPYRGGVVFSQEGGEQPVYWMNDHGIQQLLSGANIEGVATDGHFLYAIEDLKSDGRLLRYNPESGATETLRSGLEEAEAVTACPDGRLFYSEKKRGQIKQLLPDGNDRIVLDGLNAPGFLLCNREGLWVTEDTTHMARLLLMDSQGHVHEILTHLRSAQTLVETAPGLYLLAEQGRDRVLELKRTEKN
ncbi:hypothetical protein [Pseudomonas boanensis]|uniref:hypothetical protein n=1 Tax=Metapseudomonas boanensis TaxID=2822138 RepID=UPI0035D442BD